MASSFNIQNSPFIIVVAVLFALFFVPATTSAFTISKSAGNTIGLVGWWTFDGKDVQGGTIRDISGQGNHGIAVSIATSTFYAEGKIGQALNFDGVDDYIKTNDISAAEGSVITVSAWVNGVVGVASRKIVSKASASTVSWELYTSSGSGGHYGFQVCNTTPTCATARTSLGVNADGNWHFVTGTYDGTTVLLYYDGIVQSTTGSLTGDIRNTTNNVCLGSVAAGTNCTLSTFWNGLIDDVRIYNRALSATEIKNLYSQGTSRVNAANTGLKNGLVGHWTFDGKDVQGGTIRDISGNNNHGQHQNISTSTFYAEGKVGQALNFDGVDDTVSISSSIVSNSVLDLTGKNWTMSAWVQWDNSYDLDIISYNDAQSHANRLTTRNSANVGQFRLDVYGGTQTSLAAICSTTNPVNRQWYHLVGTWNGSTATIYLNGISCGTDTGSTDYDMSSDALYIGSTRGANRFWKSYIDDVRIYNRALSANEIKALYSQGTPRINTANTGLKNGLVGHWTFDGKDVQGGTIRDVSGNNNHGTAVSIATSTFYAEGKIGQGLNFDGVNDTVNAGSASTLDDIQNQGGGGMSVAFWMKPNNTSQERIISKGLSSQGTGFWTIRKGTNRGLSITKDYDGTDFAGAAAANTYQVGVWQHVVMTWSGEGTAAGTTWYYNGSEIADAASTDGIGSQNSEASSNLGIGGISGGSEFFNGSLDDVRIYNRILSASEIQQLYNSGR